MSLTILAASFASVLPFRDWFDRSPPGTPKVDFRREQKLGMFHEFPLEHPTTIPPLKTLFVDDWRDIRRDGEVNDAAGESELRGPGGSDLRDPCI